MGHVLHGLVGVAEGLDLHDLQELGDLLDEGLLGGGELRATMALTGCRTS